MEENCDCTCRCVDVREDSNMFCDVLKPCILSVVVRCLRERRLGLVMTWIRLLSTNCNYNQYIYCERGVRWGDEPPMCMLLRCRRILKCHEFSAERHTNALAIVWVERLPLERERRRRRQTFDPVRTVEKCEVKFGVLAGKWWVRVKLVLSITYWNIHWAFECTLGETLVSVTRCFLCRSRFVRRPTRE